jgi:hypothetical protein
MSGSRKVRQTQFLPVFYIFHFRAQDEVKTFVLATLYIRSKKER